MNKTELIVKVTREVNEALKEEGRKPVTKKVIGYALEAIQNQIMDTVVEGDDVKLVGFGTFTSVERAEHQGRNLMTGEEMMIPAHRIPKFKFSTGFKALVK